MRAIDVGAKFMCVALGRVLDTPRTPPRRRSVMATTRTSMRHMIVSYPLAAAFFRNSSAISLLLWRGELGFELDLEFEYVLCS